MQIYQIYMGETAFLCLLNARDARICIDSERKLNTNWVPLHTYIPESDDSREGETEHGPKDFLRFHDSWACNERSYSVLREECQNDVEFLPLDCSCQIFYWLNTIATIDALDLQKSKYVRSTSTGIISFIGVYAFNLGQLHDRTLFFLTDNRETLFATQNFVEMVSRANLGGLDFRPVGVAT